MEKIAKGDKAIEELREELLRITADPEMREAYYQREKDLRDKLSIAVAERETGIEEGIKQEKEEIVLNMYNKKLSIDLICKVVNLSKEKVEEIIKKAEK